MQVLKIVLIEYCMSLFYFTVLKRVISAINHFQYKPRKIISDIKYKYFNIITFFHFVIVARKFFIEKLNKLFSEFELKDYISGIIFKPKGNNCRSHFFAFNLKDERENHKFVFYSFCS